MPIHSSMIHRTRLVRVTVILRLVPDEICRVLSQDAVSLRLRGSDAEDAIDKATGLLDSRIFTQFRLKFLTLSSPSIVHASFPTSWPSLSPQLQELDLCHCALETIPEAVMLCSNLRVLDLRNNRLTCLPTNIGDLCDLRSLNLGSNLLSFVSGGLEKCTKLSVIDLSQNKISELPAVLARLPGLRDLIISSNQLSELPGGICLSFSGLNVMDVSNNHLRELPYELSECKLKSLNLRGNLLEDKQLRKLAERDAPAKTILSKIAGGKSRRARKEEQRGREETILAEDAERQEQARFRASLESLSKYLELLPAAETISIVVDPSVVRRRPYLVAAIVRAIDLTEDSDLRLLMDIQNKIHKSVCASRTSAAVGTHDMHRLVSGPMKYAALPCREVRFIPLRRRKEMTGEEVVRSFLTGPMAPFSKLLCEDDCETVHSHLSVLRDSSGQVLSLPPLINSSATAVSSTTKDVFIEVSSSTSLDTCKAALAVLLGRLAGHVKSKDKDILLKVEPVSVLCKFDITAADNQGRGGGNGRKRKGKTKVESALGRATLSNSQRIIFPACADDFDAVIDAAEQWQSIATVLS